jgi:hypothetical protein
MNLSEPISLNNLREMAMLEALGLLDSVDESKFEESFGGLSPALQAELLDLQAAVAAEIAAAGDEEPDRALRYKVLARLASEIERDEVACGPIASIGSRTRRLAASASKAQGAAEGEYGGASTEHRLRRSAMIWRAAAFVLGSSLLALVVIQQQSLALSGRILELADSNIAFKGLVEPLAKTAEPEWCCFSTCPECSRSNSSQSIATIRLRRRRCSAVTSANSPRPLSISAANRSIRFDSS